MANKKLNETVRSILKDYKEARADLKITRDKEDVFLNDRFVSAVVKSLTDTPSPARPKGLYEKREVPEKLSAYSAQDLILSMAASMRYKHDKINAETAFGWITTTPLVVLDKLWHRQTLQEVEYYLDYVEEHGLSFKALKVSLMDDFATYSRDKPLVIV